MTVLTGEAVLGTPNLSEGIRAIGQTVGRRVLGIAGVIAATGTAAMIWTGPASADVDGSRYTEDPAPGVGCSFDVGSPVTNPDGTVTLGKITATVPKDSEGCSTNISSAIKPANATLSISATGFAGSATISGNTLRIAPNKNTDGKTSLAYAASAPNNVHNTGEIDITVPAEDSRTYRDTVFINNFTRTSGEAGSKGSFYGVAFNTNDDLDKDADFTFTATGCGITVAQHTGTVTDPTDNSTFRQPNNSGSTKFDLPQGTYNVAWSGDGQSGQLSAQVKNGYTGSAECLPAATTTSAANAAPSARAEAPAGSVLGNGGQQEQGSGNHASGAVDGSSKTSGAVVAPDAAKPGGVAAVQGVARAEATPSASKTPREPTADDLAFARKAAAETIWQKMGKGYIVAGKSLVVLTYAGIVGAIFWRGPREKLTRA